jgi:hypothetical protein
MWQAAISVCSRLLTHFFHRLHFNRDMFPSGVASSHCCLLLADFLLDLLFDPKPGSDLFLRNVGLSWTPLLYKPVDHILHSHRCENTKSNYITYDFYLPNPSHPSHRQTLESLALQRSVSKSVEMQTSCKVHQFSTEQSMFYSERENSWIQ